MIVNDKDKDRKVKKRTDQPKGETFYNRKFKKLDPPNLL